MRDVAYTRDMKRDGRTLDHRTLEEIRLMAVAFHVSSISHITHKTKPFVA